MVLSMMQGHSRGLLEAGEATNAMCDINVPKAAQQSDQQLQHLLGKLERLLLWLPNLL